MRAASVGCRTPAIEDRIRDWRHHYRPGGDVSKFAFEPPFRWCTSAVLRIEDAPGRSVYKYIDQFLGRLLLVRFLVGFWCFDVGITFCFTHREPIRACHQFRRVWLDVTFQCLGEGVKLLYSLGL